MLKFVCVCILSGSALNDGQWHSVELKSKQDHLSITVDKDKGATAHTSIALPLTSDSQLFFGGKTKLKNMCLMCVCFFFFLLSKQVC